MEPTENAQHECLTKKEWSKPVLISLDQKLTEMDIGPFLDGSGSPTTVS
jgi:hypothetical protein